MQRLCKTVGALFVAGVIAIGFVGCSSSTTGGDNSQLWYTSANTAENQEFDTVTFGNYQGNDITWLKLGEKDGKTLLISEKVLDAKPYNDADVGYMWVMNSPRPTLDVDWADSSLRKWLNSDFLKNAFSADQQNAIAETDITDTKNNVAHTGDNGADASIHVTAPSKDKVWLLSVKEAKDYFNNNKARSAMPTDYAVKNNVYTGIANSDGQAEGASVWWLRTNGYYAGYAAVVTDDGYVHGDGYRINGELHDGLEDHGTEYKSTLGGNIGVRPVIWVETSAVA